MSGAGTALVKLDVVGQVNEKGELEENKKSTLVMFKGYRYAVDKLNHDVTVAP